MTEFRGLGVSRHLRRQRIRRRLSAVGVCASTMLTLVIAASPASATTWTTVNRSYSMTTDHLSTPLGLCLHIGVDGTIQFQQSGTSKRNPRIVNPHIYVVTKQSCARTSSLAYSASGADLTQSWFHNSCNVSASVSAGFPWSLGVAVTRTCGRHTVAERESSPRGTGSSGFDQFNSGSPVYWSSSSTCLVVIESVVVYKSGRSDSVAVPDMKICV